MKRLDCALDPAGREAHPISSGSGTPRQPSSRLSALASSRSEGPSHKETGQFTKSWVNQTLPVLSRVTARPICLKARPRRCSAL